MADAVVVGRVKGPGENLNEYTFITPDGKRAATGEFVYYVVEENGSGSVAPGSKGKYVGEALDGRKILSRITGRRSLKGYPDEMLSDPSLDPAVISEALDFDHRPELFELNAVVVGRFVPGLGFVNPRISPVAGTPVYMAEDSYMEEVISPVRHRQGSAHIGYLLNRDEGAVPVSLDVASLVSKHLAVLAATGSGKSYTVGVLLEEIMGMHNRGAVLVLDPHGEYNTLTEMTGSRPYREKLLPADGSYEPVVRVIRPGDIKIRVSDLTFGDWASIMKGASDKMLNLLRNAIGTARRARGGRHFTVSDILTELNANDDERDEASVRGLEWRINEYVERKGIFDDLHHTSLKELIAPGQITVLQLTEMEEFDQQLITSVLLHRILRARIGTEKQQVEDDSEYFLPFPVFIVLEEAHRFAPAGGESRSKAILKTILSEGRKFGVGTCLVSQRPGKLDSDVLSQCMTQVIMKIINPADQENIKQSVEAVTADILRELPALTKGQAVVVGDAINTPVLVKIRERYTTHGGESHDAPAIWCSRAMESAQRIRKMERAVLVKRGPAAQAAKGAGGGDEQKTASGDEKHGTTEGDSGDEWFR